MPHTSLSGARYRVSGSAIWPAGPVMRIFSSESTAGGPYCARMAARVPVLAGVGAVTRRDDELPGDDHIGLMVAAATQALDDAGIKGEAVGAVLVPRGSWGQGDPERVVAERLGAAGARTVMAELGIPQLSIMRRACELVADGSVDV